MEFIFFSVLLLTICSAFSSSNSNALREGAFLSVEKQDDVLVSSNGIFSAGFHRVGQNAYCFAIWFNHPLYNYQNVTSRTVVWMTNRDEPVYEKVSKLSLQKDGNLVLTDAGRLVIWATDTASLSPAFLYLHDNGNLMLNNSKGVLWQSFDSPTDTLLPLQLFTKSTKLVSSRSESNFSTGFYTFSFSDNNLLNLIFDNSEVSSVYWPPPWLVSWEAGRSTYNNSRVAMLNSLGNFSSSDDFTFLATDYGSILQRRLRMDYDGNIRLYSRTNDGAEWYVSWEAIPDPCKINGICGVNGLCTYDYSSGRKCSCLPGYKMKNRTDWTKGCEPKFNPSCNRNDSKFIRLFSVEFYGYDYGFFPNYTLSQCEELCSSLCNCKGFQYSFFNTGIINCYPKTLLLNGYRTPSFFGDLYLRLPNSYHLPQEKTLEEFSLECSVVTAQELNRTYSKKHENQSVKLLLWFVTGVGGFQLICFVSVCSFLFIRNQREARDHIGGYLVAATGFKRYSFDELKKATRGFKEEIGRGSGGIVYKGVLSDDRVAAVKRLNQEDNQGEAEFLAEVNTIGRLNHMHLMEMWGYCAEGKHRLLVYEYLEHGSLKHNLSSNVLDWKKMFEIAVGTAKGLAYVHEECLEWILHCDVKPQNILLDSNYSPKVADFGLSKLLKRGELNNSRFSRIRGTRGYMAPEWVSNEPITSKVDVYCYGIVVLEMLTGKSPTTDIKAVDETGKTENRGLVSWVRENIKGSSSDEIEPSLEKIMDPSMGEECDMMKMAKLLVVAMKCVEEEKGGRPTMSQVVEMLQDNH
ncbi:putative receptor protein kinase ZmPK1 [Ziziphus jujuba]|uniref:Receptor-like serine/threonine-protein kinase n=1 Tax=Ziziphus jujuba TaxID=326968 RepID=A0ABM4A8F4_ZIZJJ|nr:putative receptor protein kinase ZmPK1 [Ziziphus jujuba]